MYMERTETSPFLFLPSAWPLCAALLPSCRLILKILFPIMHCVSLDLTTDEESQPTRWPITAEPPETPRVQQKACPGVLRKSEILIVGHTHKKCKISQPTMNGEQSNDKLCPQWRRFLQVFLRYHTEGKRRMDEVMPAPSALQSHSSRANVFL